MSSHSAKTNSALGVRRGEQGMKTEGARSVELRRGLPAGPVEIAHRSVHAEPQGNPGLAGRLTQLLQAPVGRGLLLPHRGDRFAEFVANALFSRAGPRLERVHVGVPRVDIALDRCGVRGLIGRVLCLELRVNYRQFSIGLVELEAQLNVGSLPGLLLGITRFPKP